MSCKLLFIRHGQSLGNLNEVYLGHTDLDLSPLGVRQAEAVGDYLLNKHIDKVYCSDLLRAYHTSLPFCKESGIKPIKCTELREIFAGDWENQKFEYLINRYSKTYNIWRTDIGNAVPDNGEAVVHLFERIVSAVKSIALENDGKTIAIFTHATPIRAFFTYVNTGNVADMKFLDWASNASVSEVEFDSGKFKAIRYSFSDYLGDIATKLPTLV